MRADPESTHRRIIEAATEVFGNNGTEASLNEIAKRASVGPGTLYRHFPSREHLIDACMENWEAQLHAAAERAASSGRPPAALLLQWFEDFATHISTYRGGPARLLRALGSTEALWARRWNTLQSANAAVFERLIKMDAVRPDADPPLLCILVCGVAATAEEGSLDAGQRRALLQVIVSGTLS